MPAEMKFSDLTEKTKTINYDELIERKENIIKAQEDTIKTKELLIQILFEKLEKYEKQQVC